MKVLILTDLQNDFMPGGSMPVPGMESLFPVINHLQSSFRLVVATQDWHAKGHGSFAPNHPEKKPGDIAQLAGREQVLYPVHCVQNTKGAELTTLLMRNRLNKIVRKGLDTYLDDYSAFFDAGHEKTTGINDLLHEKKVKKVFVAGILLEKCVKNTLLDAIGLGYEAYLIEDAVKGLIAEDQKVVLLEELKQMGVHIVKVEDLNKSTTIPHA